MPVVRSVRDRRVLAQAFERAGLDWHNPPVLCTVAMARRFAPLAGQRKLAPLAEALGIEVAAVHRALVDAETCARVFCALFGRLCAHAGTVADALAVLSPPRRASRPRAGRTLAGGTIKRHKPDTSSLPDAPGVYIFRNAAGQVLYVGKSVNPAPTFTLVQPQAPPKHWWPLPQSAPSGFAAT